ncbi:hypothetical protein PTD2_18575 [Pseudoalteromonas tunicata D2]|uniref:Uncharacterized protein n=1 Tax=Pseudoalteromonas tunicata D2 TaxID=87626 RepID=A4CBW8_9GAMM|nr:hypothetical protein PTD2_18575 [Pseudoalteromonas tunicata D2]
MLAGHHLRASQSRSCGVLGFVGASLLAKEGETFPLFKHRHSVVSKDSLMGHFKRLADGPS